MDDPLVADLKEQIAKGQAIVVAGAGISIGATKNAPAASWIGFLEAGIAQCEAVGRPRPPDGWGDRQRAALKCGDLEDVLGVAEQISKRLGYPRGGEWRRWLRETIGALKVGHDPQDRAVLEALRDLEMPVATTNYDGLIEEVTDWQPVTWRDGANAERVLRGDDKGVLHLHGYWGDPESVVLGIRSYEAVLGDAHAQTVLRALRMRHTLVFVGCGAGLADPNFGALLAWTRKVFAGSEYRHFRLCRANERKDLEKQHPPEERIFPVPFGERHEDLAPFLRSLALEVRRKPNGGGGPFPPDHHRLPGRPERCIGRKDEIEVLVGALLACEPTPVLGPAGIGKSTICLEALHDRRVARRFGDRRYFVRGDRARTAADLLAEISRVLGIEPGPGLIGKITRHLAEAPVALVLDNLETPWDRQPIETKELLRQLAGIEHLALVATIRGLNRPPGVAWCEPLQVEPLRGDAPKELFLGIAGRKHENDQHLQDLLGALDGVPLAIELMAHAAEAEPDLEGVWQRWQSERTKMLQRNAADHRLLSLAVSLELSIKSPRMTDAACRLLSLLGVLPEGIARTDLDHLLPDVPQHAAAVLRQVGLAFDEARRLRTLAPVREHVAAEHQPCTGDLARAIAHYLKLASELGGVCGRAGGSEAAHRLSGETANIEKMLVLGLKGANPRPVVEAAIAFARFQRLVGFGALAPLTRAAEVASTIDEELAADASHALGELALARSDESLADASFHQARRLYKQIGDTEGEANCIRALGDIAADRLVHELAQAQYEEALAIFRQSSNVLGEAICVHGLGSIALQRSDQEGARARFEEALALFRRAGSALGEANSIQVLGDIALARLDHHAAQTSYEKALLLHRQIGDICGQANCIEGLGKVASHLLNHTGARAYFEDALSLHRQVGNVIGEANCRKKIGDLALYRLDLSGARTLYEQAKLLYQRSWDLLGEANCIVAIGNVARLCSDRRGARAYYVEAMGIYSTIEATYSIGVVHVKLARLAEDEGERAHHIAAARQIWTSIKRDDLVSWLDETGGFIGKDSAVIPRGE